MFWVVTFQATKLPGLDDEVGLLQFQYSHLLYLQYFLQRLCYYEHLFLKKMILVLVGFSFHYEIFVFID